MIDYTKIPAELRELPRWVCVSNESKVPMQAKVPKPASSTNPGTWATFEEAMFSVTLNHYDGVGFVFTNDDDIVGIDIDAGFDGDGFLSDLSRDAMLHTESYTEKSRSGRGIHIYVRGKLPWAGKNNGKGFEIYQSGRYFIVTGKRLCYGELIANQEGIDYLIAKYFSDTQKKAKRTINKDGREIIYKPVEKHTIGENGKVSIEVEYPPIPKGSRHISFVSLAGQMWSKGIDGMEIYKELCRVNKTACEEPLPERELENIIGSIERYER